MIYSLSFSTMKVSRLLNFHIYLTRPSAMSRWLAHSLSIQQHQTGRSCMMTAGARELWSPLPAGCVMLRRRGDARVRSCVFTYATPSPGDVSCFPEDGLYRRNEVIEHKPSETFPLHYWVEPGTSEHLHSSDEGEFIYVTESFLCRCRWAGAWSVFIRFVYGSRINFTVDALPELSFDVFISARDVDLSVQLF